MGQTLVQTPAAPPLMGWLWANALASGSLAAQSVKWAQGSPGLTGSCEDERKRCLHSVGLDKCQDRGLCDSEAELGGREVTSPLAPGSVGLRDAE